MKSIKIKVNKWGQGSTVEIDQTFVRAVWLTIARNNVRQSTLYIPIKQTKAIIKALQKALKIAEKNK